MSQLVVFAVILGAISATVAYFDTDNNAHKYINKALSISFELCVLSIVLLVLSSILGGLV